MLKLAQIISGVFNPLVLVVFIAAGIVYLETNSIIYSTKLFLIFAAFSVLFALFIIVSIRKGVFSNFDVSTKKQRPLLFFAATIAVICGMFFVHFAKVSNSLMVGLLIALLGVGTYQLVLPKIKASVHMGILTVFISFFIFLIGYWALPLVLLLPVVGWARVKEKEHTVPEVLAGLLIGIIFSALLIFLLQ